MLELLITYLQATFRNSMPGIDQVMGLAEKIQRDGAEFPAFYCTRDEYKAISDRENYLYFRQTGSFTEEESDEEAVSGCDHYITRTYPMVAVGYIPKSLYNTDNAFVDGKIANNIANIIRVAQYGTLLATLKADDIHTEIVSVNTNRYTVWDSEYSGVAMPARFDHVLCAVEFNIVVSATESCLRNFDCNDTEIAVNGDTINVVVTCGCPPPVVLYFPSVNTEITDAQLIGGDIEKLFIWGAGTELTTNLAVSSYDTITGTITFIADLGGQPVKLILYS